MSWWQKFKMNFPLFKITWGRSVKTKVTVPLAEGAKKIMEKVMPIKTDFAPWMKIVRAEIGVKEVPGSGNNKRVLEYHASTTLDKNYDGKDSTSWCSSFANWVMEKQGIKGTNSAWARNWVSWGIALERPVYGCIAVYERNGPGGDSHVTFWVGENSNGKFDRCIGGNQADQVKESLYEKSTVLAYRWPKGFPLPEKSGPIAKPLS